MKNLTTIVIILLLSINVLSLTLNDTKYKCPLCNYNYCITEPMSWSGGHRRLDLKVVECACMCPLPLPVCPECFFVRYKKKFTLQEKRKLRAYINTPQFRKAIKSHNSYYIAAVLMEQVKEPSKKIGLMYLEASWIDEGDSIKHYNCLEKAHASFSMEKESNLNNDNLFIWGEVLRLNGKFKKATDHFIKLKGNISKKDSVFKHLIEYELELLSSKNKDLQYIDKDKEPYIRKQYKPVTLVDEIGHDCKKYEETIDKELEKLEKELEELEKEAQDSKHY